MAKEPFPTDRGWAWAIVIGSFVCVFFMVGTAKSTGMFLIEFQSEFPGVPTSLAAMVMGASAIVYAPLAPVCIMLGQTFTARQVILCGSFIGFVGMSLGSLLFSMEYVIATFGICFGIGNAAIYGNVLVMLGVYFHKRRTLANGLALTGASVGQFVMPPFIEFLLETYGLQGCLLLVGGVYLHVMVAASLFRPPSFWADPLDQTTLVPPQVESNNGAQENGRLETIDESVDQQAVDNKKLLEEELDTSNSPLMTSPKDRSLTSSPKDCSNSSYSPLKEVNFTDSVEECGDSSYSPLVSTTPRKERNSVSFDGVNGTADKVDSPSRMLTYRSFMASNGSLCMRPLSVYGSSVLFEPHDLCIEDWEEIEGDKKKGKSAFCAKLAAMFDFGLIKSYVAVFIIVANFFSFFGYFNFVLFLPATVMSRGVTKYDKAMLVSVCGIGDLLGRLSTAFVGDHKRVVRYKLQAAGILLVGLNVGLFVFADTFIWMAVHCAMYGFFGGVYVSLAAVVIIDFVGMKKMPRLLALVMLIQGVGASVGQPLLGAVRDSTGSFQSVVVICCISMLIGGCILFLYPFVIKLEKRRPENYRLLPDNPIESCISIPKPQLKDK